MAGIGRRRSAAGACVPGDEFGGRESIFSICHTNEFVGTCKRAPEPAAACCGVNPCRRDYERGDRDGAKKGFSPEPRPGHAHCSPSSGDSGGAVQLAGHPVPGRKAFCCETHCFPSVNLLVKFGRGHSSSPSSSGWSRRRGRGKSGSEEKSGQCTVTTAWLSRLGRGGVPTCWFRPPKLLRLQHAASRPWRLQAGPIS